MTKKQPRKPREHQWCYPETGAYISFPFCRVCGVVQRRDGLNQPCKGPTRLRPMER